MDPLKDAREIFWAGVGAVDGYGVVKANLELREDSLLVKGEEIPLGRRVFVVGAGKASCWMGKALEEVLGDRIRGGVIVTKYGHRVELERIRVIEAGHPVPDQRGLEGAREVLEVCKGLSEHDLLICLLSGGGSALLPLPQEGLSLRDKQTATELLLHSGARIQELNAIRKHLSGIKGGRLALWAHPARVLTLIISDVVGDELDVIASGPTVPDRSTYADALSVIERYGLREKMPPSVIEILEKGIRGELSETPKPGDSAFGKVKNVILASNLQCLMASERQARGLGYNTLVLSSMIEGEARLSEAMRH